jgi:uncharacterized RDD family membrane protein YckC
MTELKGDATKRRFFAFDIDTFVALIPGLLVASNLPAIGPLTRGAVLCTIYLLYFIACEAIWGRTLGKLLCGLRVVGLDGQRCTSGQAVVRNLLRVADANPFLLGGLPAAISVLATRKNQRLGDLAARTLVVRTEPPKEYVAPSVTAAFD